MAETIRAVFDCNILLQGLASPDGAAGKCVQLAMEGKVALFVSPYVLEELRDVAARPTVVRKLKLTAERVEVFFEAIQIAATILTGFSETFSYQRDPDDAHYVNLALAAGAKWLVSWDKDLLDLMDESREEGRDFCGRYPAVRIVEPVYFLAEAQTAGG